MKIELKTTGMPIEGEVQSPQQRQKLFKNLDAALDYLKFSRPAAFSVESGVVYGGTEVVWRVNYIHSEGGE